MADSSQQLFCMQCGAPLAPEHNFCTQCGTRRHTTGPVQPEPAEQPAQEALQGQQAAPRAQAEPAEEAVPDGQPLPDGAGIRPATDAEGEPHAEAPAGPAGKPGRRRWLLPALALFVLLGGAGGAGYWYLNRPQIAAVEVGAGFRADNTLSQTLSAFTASDVIHGSVLVKKPKAGQTLAVRWVREDEEVVSQEIRLPRTEEETRLSVSLAPDTPLEPGSYVLEVSLPNGPARSAAFTVEPAPPLEVKNFRITSSGKAAERVPSTARSLSVAGTVFGANRFTDLTVVWKWNGVTVRREEIPLTRADLERAAEGIPISSTLDGDSGPYARPGEYTVTLMDGSKEVASRSVTVFVGTNIHSLAISEDVDDTGEPMYPSDSFYWISEFYATWYVESAPAGTRVEVRFYQDGELQDHLTSYHTYDWDVHDEYDWVRIYSTSGWSLPSSDWSVELYVNDRLTDVVSFTIY